MEESLMKGLPTIKPADLTAKSIGRAKLLVLGAALAFPMGWLPDLYHGSSTAIKIILPLLSLPFLAMLIMVLFHPVVGDLSYAKAGADEWVVRNRLKARSFTYHFILILVFIVFVGFVLSGLFHGGHTAITLADFDVVTLLLNIIGLMIVVPAAYMAWTVTPLDDE
jgi:hypothetical protein